MSKSNPVVDRARILLSRGARGRGLPSQLPRQLPHVPSGSPAIDLLISGGDAEWVDTHPPCPGFPRRRITEVTGGESSGKTTLCLRAAASVQRAGGSVLYVSYGVPLDLSYAEKIGVTLDPTFKLVAPDSTEDGFRAMFAGIAAGASLVINDSISLAVPERTRDQSLTTHDPFAATSTLSHLLPKVCEWLGKYPTTGSGAARKTDTGHPGTALLVTTNDPHGCKALKFYTTLRLQVTVTSVDPNPRTYDVRLVKSKITGHQGCEIRMAADGSAILEHDQMPPLGDTSDNPVSADELDAMFEGTS